MRDERSFGICSFRILEAIPNPPQTDSKRSEWLPSPEDLPLRNPGAKAPSYAIAHRKWYSRFTILARLENSLVINTENNSSVVLNKGKFAILCLLPSYKGDLTMGGVAIGEEVEHAISKQRHGLVALLTLFT